MIIFCSGCGPSACDCAQLLKANYNRGLFWQYGMSSDDKKKTQDCMDKFDGYLNAERKCGGGGSNTIDESENKEGETSTNDNSQVNNHDVNDVGNQIDSATPTGVDNNNVSESIVINYYHIQDPDGYSNLRESPNGKIIRKVYPNEAFTIIDSLDSFMFVEFSDGSVGYIHKSRVVKR
jgi:hypothetical protein